MNTGGLRWPCSHWLHPLCSAMQINPNERAAESDGDGEMLEGEKMQGREGTAARGGNVEMRAAAGGNSKNWLLRKGTSVCLCATERKQEKKSGR